jgi:hypothetical protein
MPTVSPCSITECRLNLTCSDRSHGGKLHVGAGTASAGAEAFPHYTDVQVSSALTGLGSHVVTGGVATLNVTVSSQTNFASAVGTALSSISTTWVPDG